MVSVLFSEPGRGTPEHPV